MNTTRGLYYLRGATARTSLCLSEKRHKFRTFAALLTLALHAALLLSLVRVTGSAAAPPPKTPNRPPAAHLHAHSDSVDVLLIPGDGKGGIHKACAGYEYVGIGIMLSSTGDWIILVGENTPASRSGLKPRDTVLNREALNDMRLGAVIRLVIERGGSQFPVQMTAATICND